MKVSACTQIFSNTVGSLMKRIATWKVTVLAIILPMLHILFRLLKHLSQLIFSRVIPPTQTVKTQICANYLMIYGVFLNDEEIAGVKVLEENISIPEIPNLTIRKSKVERSIITYISGYFVKRVLKIVKNCKFCQQNYLYSDYNGDTDFIEARTYQQSNLTVPGTFVTFITGQALNRSQPLTIVRNSLTSKIVMATHYKVHNNEVVAQFLM
ncbi:hypothetical protein NQ317_003609, partial [Molorchus minor]